MNYLHPDGKIKTQDGLEARGRASRHEGVAQRRKDPGGSLF